MHTLSKLTIGFIFQIEQGEYETADERAERLWVEKEARMSDEDLLQIPVNGSLSLLVTRLDEEYNEIPSATITILSRICDSS